MAKKKRSEKERLEERFLEVWRKQFPELPEPTRQYRFHGRRQWRFDYCWPDYMVAVEIQGGSFMRRFKKGGRGGGHNTAIGQAKDYEKHREAARLGWKLLPFNTHDLQEKLDKKGWRKFTIHTSVLYVGELIETLMQEQTEYESARIRRLHKAK